ncbi:sperm-associated antigen 1-like [Bolinopsis microptera]|uniref:sperm-associated antigen 1-like n=1 Tax=Bolinopsis microptera TaxID=2820187 RepID=UPI003078B77F
MAATANLAQALGGGPSPAADKSEVPVEHLDYTYINNCTSGKELEQILKVLRSGKEGRWQDLESRCEQRLSEVYPKSKLLRVATSLLKPGALDEETRKNVDQDITDWLNNMNERDNSLKNSKNLTFTALPEVRQTGNVDSNRLTEEEKAENKANPDRINSYDYRAWDRYNPDEECEKIDEEIKTRPKPSAPKSAPKTTVNPEALTDEAAKERASEMEKNKGNEAFKAGDFEESINYYTNSIDIFPSTATYNNRGLAKIRLERFYKALEDFNWVLDKEPDNVKALLRRADTHEKIGQIKEAHADLQRSVIVDENNKRAKQLLEVFVERNKKLLAKGGKRMKIIESSSDEEEEERSKVSPPGKQTKLSSESQSPAKIPCTRPDPTPAQPAPEPVTPASEPVNTPSKPATPETVVNETEVVLEMKEGTPPKPQRQIIHILPLPEKVVKLKAAATSLFTNGMYGDAVSKYTECVDSLDRNNPGYWYHISLLLSNRAACKLKIGQCTESIKDCNDSLVLNPGFFKSVLRRAIAFENIENYKKAYEDYRLTILMDPSQVTAQQGVSRTSEILRKEFGSSWRDHVTNHASYPESPEFVDPAKPRAPVPTPTPAQPSKPEPAKKPASSPSKPAEKPTPVKPVPETKPAKPTEPAKPAKPTEPVKTVPKAAPKATPQETSPPKKADYRMPTKEEQYAKFKDQGNAHVSKQQYREALRCYDKCITLNKDMVPAHLNSALCHLKLGNHKKVMTCVDEVLKLEPNNIKALYRRAAANNELKKYPAAAKDLKFVVEKDPGNKPAAQLLEQVKKLWSQELRGMQSQKSAPPPPQQQPAQQRKKGRKIPIVQDSDSEDSEEEVKPQKQTKPERPVKPEPVKEPTPKPQPVPEKKAAPQIAKGNDTVKGNKPWMKKNNTSGSHNQTAEAPTAFSFLQHWSAYKKKKDIEQFGKVLESCDPQSFPKIFSSSIDADMVIAIVDAVDKYFIPSQQHQKALEILQAVTKVQRFDVMTMLMSQKDKSTISDVINRLEGDERVIKSLHSRFS